MSQKTHGCAAWSCSRALARQGRGRGGGVGGGAKHLTSRLSSTRVIAFAPSASIFLSSSCSVGCWHVTREYVSALAYVRAAERGQAADAGCVGWTQTGGKGDLSGSTGDASASVLRMHV